MNAKMLLPIVLLTAGCATTDPLSGGNMEYRLPRTDAVPTLTLTLKDCDTLAVESDLKLVPKPGAQSRVFEIPGYALASERIRRALKLTVNANGVITGVNSSVSERTPQVIGNYIKTAAKLLPFLLSNTPGSLECTPAVSAAAARAKVVKAQMTELRRLLSTSGQVPSAADREKMEDLVNLGTELGTLTTLLTIDVPGEIQLPDNLPSTQELEEAKTTMDAAETGASYTALERYNVKLDGKPFEKWFGPGVDPAALAASFGLQWRAYPLTRAVSGLTRSTGSSAGLRECRVAIATPDTIEVQVLVWGTGTLVPNLKKKITTHVAQWADAGELCIDAGFGETRSIELAFDEFGRTTSYGWSSEATAETISGAVAGAAEDAVSLGKALRGQSELETKKAEIDELETQQKLEALRACKVIRDAGGQCPSE